MRTEVPFARTSAWARVALVTASTLLTGLPPGAAEPAERPSIEIELTAGGTVTLSDPFLRATLRGWGISLHSINLDRLVRMERVAGGPGLRFAVTFRDPDAQGVFDVEGEASVGRSVPGYDGGGHPLRNLERLVVRPGRPLSAAGEAAECEVRLRAGPTLRGRAHIAGWTFAGDRDGLVGTVGDIELALRTPRALRELEVTDGGVRLVLHDGTSVGGWRVRPVEKRVMRPDGRIVPETSVPPTLSLETGFGSATIPWPAVAAVRGPTPSPRPAEEARPPSLRIVSVAGAEVTVPGLDFASGSIGAADVELFLEDDALSRLERSGQTFTGTMVDGRQLTGLTPRAQGVFEGEAHGLRVTLPWTQVQRLERPAAVPRPPEDTEWTLTTRAGLELPLRALDVYEESSKRGGAYASGGRPVVANGELEVKQLAWDRVQRGWSEPQGLAADLGEAQPWTLTGTLVGTSPYGAVRFYAIAVARLERTRAPAARAAPNRPLIGRLRTSSGRSYLASSLVPEGGPRAAELGHQGPQNKWGTRVLTWPAPVGALWLATSALAQHGLVSTGSPTGLEVRSAHPLVADAGAVPLTGVGFENDLGSFVVRGRTFQAWEPPPTLRVAKPHAVYRVTARTRAPAGSHTWEASQLEFVRFPALAKPGYYRESQWPFRWHTDGALLFVRQGSDRVESIPLEQLRLLTLGAYRTDRQARVRRDGDDGEWEGRVYPGPVEEHGISKWDAHNEGLRVTIEEGAFVFLRFADLESVVVEKL